MIKYKTKVTYRIYEISNEGHLKIPTNLKIGMDYSEPVFNDSFDSIEKAKQEIIENSESFGEYVILTIVNKIRTE